MNHYPVGSSVTVTGTFTNKATGALVDPSAPQVDVVTPGGRITTYAYGGSSAVQKAATGIYTFDIDTTGMPGRWQYRWWSPPGIAQSAGNSEFIIDPFPSPTP